MTTLSAGEPAAEAVAAPAIATPADPLSPVGQLVARFATPLFVAACLPVWFLLVGQGLPMLAASMTMLVAVVTTGVLLEATMRNPRLEPRAPGTWHVVAFYNGFVTPAVAIALPSLVLIPGGHWLGQQLGTASLWPDVSLAMDVWLVLILVDFTSYWWHRFEHTIVRWGLPWRIHSVHHAPRYYDFWMGARVHPVDVVIFALIGFTLMSLLGAPVMAVEAVATFAAVVGAIHHLAAETRGGVFNWFVPFADHHAVHHSIRADENGNYGNITTFFDQLFGSYIEPRPADESPCGAFSLVDDYPNGDIVTQLLSPLGGAAWQRVARPKTGAPTKNPRPPVLPDRGWRRLWAIGWLVGITALVAWLG